MRWVCLTAILITASGTCAAASSLGRGGVRSFRNLAGLNATAAAAGVDGTLLVGGMASAAGLPVTPDAVRPNFRSATCPTGGVREQPLCVDGYVAKFAADGTLLFGTYLWGGANVIVVSVAPAPDGAIYAAVMANAGVDGVPNPVSIDGATRLHIVRLSADGSGSVTGFMVKSGIAQAKVVIDRDGNLYIGGTCDTGGCVLSFAAGSSTPRYVYSLGVPQSSVRDLTVEDVGNVYLAGSTPTREFPGASLGWNGVQAGDLAPGSSYGFVAELDANGSSVIWSSVFGGPLSGGAIRVLRNASGEIAVVGLAVQDPLFRFNRDLSPLVQISVVKFAGDPTAPVYSVQVAAGIDNASVDAAMDGEGSVLLTGMTSFLQPGGVDSPSLPTTADALERCASGTKTRFFLRLDAGDGSVRYSSLFGADQEAGGSRVALGREGVFYVAGNGPTGTGVTILDSALAPARARLCAVHAANFRPDALAAGGLIAIFGSDLEGAQVLLNGEAIRLISVEPTQIVAALPVDAPSNARLEVRGAGASQTIEVEIRRTAPGLFRRFGSIAAVVINEDGTANGPDNPAMRGSVVRAYGTGFGGALETFIGNQSAELVGMGPVGDVTELRIRVPEFLPPAFQSVANFQFRTGLFILQTDLFFWVR